MVGIRLDDAATAVAIRETRIDEFGLVLVEEPPAIVDHVPDVVGITVETVLVG